MGFLAKKIPPKNLPNIYFLTAWQHWLGITKPKNVFRSTLNLCIKLLWNFKNFLFNRFFYWLTIWLIDYLTDWLTPSDKRNTINTKSMSLISSLFNITSSQDVPFHQPLQLQCSHHDSTKACLCSSLFSIPFFTTAYRWQFAVAPLRGFMKNLVTAVIAEVFNMLSFCLKFSAKC